MQKSGKLNILWRRIRTQWASESNSICVEVNDRGPFARGADGKALKPLQADPNKIIDLTPEAFEKLTGVKDAGKNPCYC